MLVLIRVWDHRPESGGATPGGFGVTAERAERHELLEGSVDGVAIGWRKLKRKTEWIGGFDWAKDHPVETKNISSCQEAWRRTS